MFSDTTRAIKKKKRFRTAFTTEQLLVLEKTYSRQKYINVVKREELVNTLKIGHRCIKIWFQNRRMKEKRELSGSDTSSESASVEPLFLGGTKVDSKLTHSHSNGTINRGPESVPSARDSVLTDLRCIGPLNSSQESVPSAGDSILTDTDCIGTSNSGDEGSSSPPLEVTDDQINIQENYQFPQNSDQSYRLPNYFDTNPGQPGYGNVPPNTFPTYPYNVNTTYTNQYSPYVVNNTLSQSCGYIPNSEVNNYWISNQYPYYATL